MVYLVGAGPGDPGLVTVKALDLLRRADVVLYDSLVDTSLLAETRPDCTLVDVGKRAGRHTKSQDETTSLLVEYGSRGIEVVRLKGGDPFLFGRGAEEAEELREADIPFVVVPGVSALTGATTYAGIPLTHRDHASSFAVATGHGARGKRDDPVRWEKLAGSADTIVVFMGVGNITSITDRLIGGGLAPGTPAALIQNGTLPGQRTVCATLGTIAVTAGEQNVTPPALLIVGDTVALHGRIGWFTPGPLAGHVIGVTRPLAQSRSFAERIRDLGGTPVLMPAIAIEHTIDTPGVREAVNGLGKFDAVVFSSVNGVESFFRAMVNMGHDSRCLAGKRAAAIGPATGDALRRHGVIPDIVAETYVAEGLLDALVSDGAARGRSILLVRSDIGRDTLPAGLREAGARVVDEVFYRTRPVKLTPTMLDMVRDGCIDVVTFTSSSTVRGYFESLSGVSVEHEPSYASIGPQTSAALRRHGAEPSVEAEVYTTDGLISSLTAFLTRANDT